MVKLELPLACQPSGDAVASVLADYEPCTAALMLKFPGDESGFLSHQDWTLVDESRFRSVNVWWLAIPSFGESWHNLHHADPTCARPRFAQILSGAVGSLVTAMTQNDLVRIYTLALLTGMDYRFTAVRQDYPDDNRPLNFEPEGLEPLFAEGYRVGLTGDGWRSDPPGFRPDEQVVPRDGTRFRVPARR